MSNAASGECPFEKFMRQAVIERYKTITEFNGPVMAFKASAKQPGKTGSHQFSNARMIGKKTPASIQRTAVPVKDFR